MVYKPFEYSTKFLKFLWHPPLPLRLRLRQIDNPVWPTPATAFISERVKGAGGPSRPLARSPHLQLSRDNLLKGPRAVPTRLNYERAEATPFHE